MNYLLCRPSHTLGIDPLPSGYGLAPAAHSPAHSYSAPRGLLGPTFVPLQPPPDGEMDVGTFRTITELKQNADLALAHMKLLMDTQAKQKKGITAAQWNTVHACIRDYFEQTFTGWLFTHREHTRALHQLSLAGIYYDHHAPVNALLTPPADDHNMYRSMRLSRLSGLSHLPRPPCAEDEEESPVTIPRVPISVLKQNVSGGRRHTFSGAPPREYSYEHFPPQQAYNTHQQDQQLADTAPDPPEKPQRVRPASLRIPLIPPGLLDHPSPDMPHSHSQPVGLAHKNHPFPQPRPRATTWDIRPNAASAYSKALQSLCERVVPEGREEYAKALDKVRRAEGGVGEVGGVGGVGGVTGVGEEERREGKEKKQAIPRVRPPSYDFPPDGPAAALARLTQDAPTTGLGNQSTGAYEGHGEEINKERKTRTPLRDTLNSTHASFQDASTAHQHSTQPTHFSTPSNHFHPSNNQTPGPLPNSSPSDSPGPTLPPKHARDTPDAPASDVSRLPLVTLPSKPGIPLDTADQKQDQGRENEKDQDIKETGDQVMAPESGNGYESWGAARRMRISRRLSDQLKNINDIERNLHTMPKNGLLHVWSDETYYQYAGQAEDSNRGSHEGVYGNQL